MAENIGSIMNVTMEKIRSLVDSQTIVGDPITVGGVTVIPISKVSFALASGGSDFPSKTSGSTLFGGGGGAGATVTPVSFIVIKGNEVKLLNINEQSSPLEKAIDTLPVTIEKISDIFKKETPDGK